MALELKQKVHGVACPKYAGSEQRLAIGVQLSAVVVEADADPAKIPTPDMMESLHCDFTVHQFHFEGLVLCVASDVHRLVFDVPLGNATMRIPMDETTTEKV